MGCVPSTIFRQLIYRNGLTISSTVIVESTNVLSQPKCMLVCHTFSKKQKPTNPKAGFFLNRKPAKIVVLLSLETIQENSLPRELNEDRVIKLCIKNKSSRSPTVISTSRLSKASSTMKAQRRQKLTPANGPLKMTSSTNILGSKILRLNSPRWQMWRCILLAISGMTNSLLPSTI